MLGVRTLFMMNIIPIVISQFIIMTKTSHIVVTHSLILLLLCVNINNVSDNIMVNGKPKRVTIWFLTMENYASLLKTKISSAFH